MKAVLFLAGFGCFWEVQLFGKMSLAEIFFMVGGSFYVLKHFRLLGTGMNVRRVLVLCVAWLGMQVVTDLVRDSAMHDWARGWAKIVMITGQFLVFYLLIRVRESRILAIASGMALGLIVAGLVRYASFGMVALWKFGWSLPALFALSLVYVRWPNFRGYAVGLVALGGLSMALSFRSFAGVCFASAAFWTLRSYLQGRFLPERFMALARWLAGGSVFGLLSAVAAFSFLALNGWMGEEEQFRTEIQVRRGLGLLGNAPVGEYVGLLAGGRGEFVIALKAITDSPFIGHGSWAKNFYYADMWLNLSGEGRMSEIRNEQIEVIEPGLIPSHSHILGAWVDGGLAGALFWIYVLAIIYAGLALCLCSPQPFAPFLIPVFTLLIWDIFFSPISAQMRLFDAFYLAIAVCMVERAKYAAMARPIVPALSVQS